MAVVSVMAGKSCNLSFAAEADIDEGWHLAFPDRSRCNAWVYLDHHQVEDVYGASRIPSDQQPVSLRTVFWNVSVCASKGASVT